MKFRRVFAYPDNPRDFKGLFYCCLGLKDYILKRFMPVPVLILDSTVVNT